MWAAPHVPLYRQPAFEVALVDQDGLFVELPTEIQK
jgi:hypothetical protein